MINRIRPAVLSVSIVVVLMAFFVIAADVSAQSPPVWPTPVVTPTPSPMPEAQETPPAPSETPVPQETDEQPPAPTPEATTTASTTPAQPGEAATPVPETSPPTADDSAAGPGADEGEGDETAAANSDPVDDETPKSEVETNPGDVAFTDYHAFDLDEIEYEPAKTKWGNFVNGLRGIARYSLFDGKLRFRLGGRVQIDGTAGTGDATYEQNYSPIDSDFSVRRLKLFAVGRVNKFNFNLGFNFGPDWGIADAWIEGAEGGLEVWGKYLGKLRVGWMQEPFSMGRQNGSYNLGLMERSLPVQTIAPGSNIGAMVHDSGPKGRFSWAMGLFSVGQENDANASGSLLSLSGRFTYCPVFRDEGRRLMHFGLSVSSRTPTGATRYRSRPEARFVDYLVDTGDISASHLTLLGLEFASVSGPLWVQAEYIRSEVSAQMAGDPVFMGSYVQVGWFITGESKPYRKNSGTFDRLTPRIKYAKGNPIKKKNGGAWEVVGRLSRVDLTDGEVEGGVLVDFSAGLSWYLNATTRVEINYIRAMPKDRGAANIGLLRIQYQPW